jgi:hypothetical protein
MGTRSQRIVIGVVLIAFVVAAVVLFRGGGGGGGLTPTPRPSSAPINAAAYQPGVRSKSTGCAVANPYPDTACTPGAVLTSDVQAICAKGYASTVRNVPQSEKNAVYAEYGIKTHKSGEYEVDHLISLELGGSNDLANLWPEAAKPQPGFHEKDKVENYLHDQVCTGKISLADAQRRIATAWLEVYRTLPGSTGTSSQEGNP